MAMGLNEYEEAFENWLVDNRVQYIAVNQQRRRIFARSRIKSFDFLVYPANSGVIIAEIKGRKYKGTNLAQLASLECWVTMDDVRGLIRWEQIFNRSADERARGPRDNCEALFIFAYKFEKVDVDTDGKEVYEFADDQYMFYAVRLDDYRAFMTVRSPKWQTVTLPAARFREFAIPIRELLLD